MNGLVQLFGTTFDLILVVIGFGLIVFVHELGHFVAARWAGIRVLAFAMGFGPAVLSYRKGLGLRRGSSEAEYVAMFQAEKQGAARRDVHAVSPTEYRLNVLPFGGYVKMLGQEDINPNAVSDAPDSYQNCKPWKRMIVISAGVIMNIIAAAALFITVFMIGLKVEPAKVGSVIPGSPAATAMADNAAAAGITHPGLMPGDVFLKIEDRTANSFSDLILATAMGKKDRPVELTVQREGVAQPLLFRITPRVGEMTGLLEMGVEPSRSAQIAAARSEEERAQAAKLLDEIGLPRVQPGMRLVRIGSNAGVQDGNALLSAIRNSEGKPVEVMFRGPVAPPSAASGPPGAKPGRDDRQPAAEEVVILTLNPKPQMQLDHAPLSGAKVTPVEHLLGLTPVMRVKEAMDRAKAQGLQTGDIFARIGNVEYPSVVQGMTEIKAHKGGTLPMVVLRRAASGALAEVSLPGVSVTGKGTVGFYVDDTSDDSSLVALPIAALRRPGEKQDFRPSAAGVILSPGTRILSVNTSTVANFAQIRAALRDATREAFDSKSEGATVVLTVQRPLAGQLDDTAPTETVEWTISHADVQALHALGWESPLVMLPFEPEQVMLKGSNPVDAVRMGLSETRRVMLTTYITFARLAEGTVKVEHLKGPVGIAHLGTMIAGQGLIKLLFFLALISVNLAVINFLPLPIVDGGQFLFLIFEQIRGKPVPIGVQNAATLAGLVLIGSMFLIVTYNDISNLLGL